MADHAFPAGAVIGMRRRVQLAVQGVLIEQSHNEAHRHENSKVDDDQGRTAYNPECEPGEQLKACFFAIRYIVRHGVFPGIRSIWLEFFFPAVVFLNHGLISFFHQEIFHDQEIHLGSHKAAIGIFRGTDNGLATYIE